ncbi:MAG: ORF6N domain-containing protein [Elusimicrobia bacterium]|nr:ORF6N domain-containing protein [Elusimicrobiota bacterium]
MADKILLIREQKVLLDKDLATLYGVPVRVFNQAVKRNINRFPKNFMFQLTKNEYDILRSQNVTSSSGHGGRRYLPYVFTEQGEAMLSSVLSSKRAIEVNIQIMRAFVKLREIAFSQKDLIAKINDLESKFNDHDTKIQSIFTAIKQLMILPEKSTKKIGF